MKSHRQMRRPCPVPMCGNAARVGHLMCLTCWGAVPRDKQTDVNRTWRGMRASLRDRSEHLLDDLAAYRKASDAAIAAAERARP